MPGKNFTGNGLHKSKLRDASKSTMAAKNFDHKGSCMAKNGGTEPCAHIDEDLVHVDASVGNSDASDVALLLVAKMPCIVKNAIVHS